MKVKSGSEVAQSCLTLRPHGLWPTRLLHPWDFLGKSTGVGCHWLIGLLEDHTGQRTEGHSYKETLYRKRKLGLADSSSAEDIPITHVKNQNVTWWFSQHWYQGFKKQGKLKKRQNSMSLSSKGPAVMRAANRWRTKQHNGFLMAQWLGIRLPVQETRVQSLVRDLRSHMPWGN